MLLHLKQVLSLEELGVIRHQLMNAGDAWVDGKVTAGYQGAPVKKNQQLDEQSAIAQALGDRILQALERHPLFISATLPRYVYPPMFNRYGEGMAFGNHVDGAVRMHPQTGQKMRTDVSATLFLADPETYDGGELQIEDSFGVQSVKLPAGDMVIYPATSLHQVTAVTRGTRMASFFWIQSMVRDDTQRTLLFDMDTAIQQLNATHADTMARTRLMGCYHNLLRQWSEV